MSEHTFDHKFNIIKHRGDPTEAETASGHTVEKQTYVYFRDPQGEYQYVRCAQYHNEHFIYVDPVFNEDGPQARGRWFAMCTCGSPAVLVGEDIGGAVFDPEGKLLVCQEHTRTLLQTGIGQHQTGDGRRWD